jgi:hypothetical protein
MLSFGSGLVCRARDRAKPARLLSVEMPVHWEPSTFEDFSRALREKRCEVVVHRWTKQWAQDHGWKLWSFGFKRGFVKRVSSSEEAFWQAYNDGAFNLHLREAGGMWGR